MTEQIFLWIAGAGMVSFVGFCIRINFAVKELLEINKTPDRLVVNSMVKELLDMHKDPDTYGFGTISPKRVIENNSKVMVRVADCMEDMDDVLRWMTKNLTDGNAPPPRIRKVKTDG